MLQIKENVRQLMTTAAEANKRSSSLAMELVLSRQETSSLFKLLQDLLTKCNHIPGLGSNNNPAAAMNLQAMELPRRPGHNAGQGSELVQQVPPLGQGLQGGPTLHGRTLEANAPPVRSGGLEKASLRRGLGADHTFPGASAGHNGSCEPRGGTESGRNNPPTLTSNVKSGAMGVQLAPVAQLDASSGLNHLHRESDRDRMDTSRLTSLAEVVSREDLGMQATSFLSGQVRKQVRKFLPSAFVEERRIPARSLDTFVPIIQG